jgi:hypothetical protein
MQQSRHTGVVVKQHIAAGRTWTSSQGLQPKSFALIIAEFAAKVHTSIIAEFAIKVHTLIIAEFAAKVHTLIIAEFVDTGAARAPALRP